MIKNVNSDHIKFWFEEAAPGAVARVLRQVLHDYELGSVLRGHIDYELVAEAINTRSAGKYVPLIYKDILACAGWNQFKPLYDRAEEDKRIAVKDHLERLAGSETCNLRESYFACGPLAQYKALCIISCTEPDKHYILKLISE